MPEVINLTKLKGRHIADPLRAVVEAEVEGLTLRGLKLEWHGPNHWRLVPPGRKVQHQWQIIYDFSTRAVYDCLLQKVVQVYDSQSKTAQTTCQATKCETKHYDDFQDDDTLEQSGYQHRNPKSVTSRRKKTNSRSEAFARKLAR